MPKETLKNQFGFTRAQLDLLIKTMNTLIKRAVNGQIEWTSSGICHNWDMALPLEMQYMETRSRGYINIPYELVSYLAMTWPLSKYPGRPSCFPIPSVPDDRMWAGKNLELRLSLMRYIAHRLRDWRRRTPA
jgi:hypothetical protein